MIWSSLLLYHSTSIYYNYTIFEIHITYLALFIIILCQSTYPWTSSLKTKTGCPYNPTHRSSTPSSKKWEWSPPISPSKNWCPPKNGHYKWSPNPHSASSSSMRKHQPSNNTSNKKHSTSPLKSPITYSSWGNMPAMPAEPSHYSTSSSMLSINTPISSQQDHTSITSDSMPPTLTLKLEANSSKRINKFSSSTSRQLSKDNQAYKMSAIRISLRLLSRMED